jgi:streptogramin lyase
LADPCLPCLRKPHCVADFETDQSSRFTAATRPARRPWALAVGAALALTLAVAGCGNGADASRVPPQPSAQRPIEVGGTPVAIAVGEGGAWVVDNTGGRVVHLDPRRGRPTGRPIPVGSGPESIAAGEGAVWVASGNDTVTRIDPATGRASRAPVKVADPAGIAAGEGSVWVTSRADGTVTRIDPKTLRATGDPITAGSQPGDIATGAGAVWVANTADGTVTRIDASSGQPGDPIQVADHQVLGLAYGEGAVWVAKTDDPLARTIEVVRIDPGSSQVGDGAAEVPAAIPVRLAAGEGGVWVTLVGGVRPPDLTPRPGGVALVDPASVKVASKPVRVGDRPSGIALGDGGIWVADSGDGTVTRIDPHAG